MVTMRIEDAFTLPDGRTVVTGRPVGGDVRLGGRLWLTGDRTAPREVVVTAFLRICGRQDATLARDGLNAAMTLGGLPPDAILIGRTLRAGDPSSPARPPRS
ncbi:hypothetical protein ACFO1B_16550 [Dactylosporangium siamense]|uniref:Uncharacterized protein n=1 Tax=Dactylosporangium siamense TaxID=685454 RepID=A0A919PNM6_9ACTN|nr:hypothetical protein [Dactylosporangium siamense]GIG45453.1 hypothetical protein Dsi01nite_034940 [Dactylosporangium siamense]